MNAFSSQQSAISFQQNIEEGVQGWFQAGFRSRQITRMVIWAADLGSRTRCAARMSVNHTGTPLGKMI